jgi:hypothetical protein
MAELPALICMMRRIGFAGFVLALVGGIAACKPTLAPTQSPANSNSAITEKQNSNSRNETTAPASNNNEASTNTSQSSEAATRQNQVLNGGPTAVEVARVLSKTSEASDTTNAVTDADRNSGVVSSAVMATSQPAGLTIKVYRSGTERNQARLRLVQDCPGCNFITECGPILAYEPILQSSDINKILNQKARERYEILKRHYKCD